MIRVLVLVVFVLGVGTPLGAQTRRVPPVPLGTVPSVSFRPFAVVAAQSFSAAETFKAVFGRALQPFFGGGLDVTFRRGLYIDAAVSRFSRTGQRAFRFGDQSFGLGVPLTVTETPFEITMGYRRRSPRSRLVPYVGGGMGVYSYKEASEGADSKEDVALRHAGYLAVGGVEFRLGRRAGVSADLQYTRVPGILGAGGISKEAAEDDLGGVALRFRVIVGR